VQSTFVPLALKLASSAIMVVAFLSPGGAICAYKDLRKLIVGIAHSEIIICALH
jgi:hypothetical protein